MVPCSFSCLSLRYLARRIFLFFCASFRAASVACFGSSTPDPDPAAASFCVDLRLRLDCHCAAAARATTSPHPSFAEHTKHLCLPQGVGFLRQQPLLLFCRQRQHLFASPLLHLFLTQLFLRSDLESMSSAINLCKDCEPKKRRVFAGARVGGWGRHPDFALLERSPKPVLLSKTVHGVKNATLESTRETAKSGG